MPHEKERLALANQLRPRLFRISQALRREAATSPLTPAQMAVLNLLLLKPLRVSDLARAEAVTLPTMTQIVKRMTEAGWVTRQPRAGTSRGLLEITEEGRMRADEVAARRNADLVARLARIPATEYDKLFDIVPLLDEMFEIEPWAAGGPAEPPDRLTREPGRKSRQG